MSIIKSISSGIANGKLAVSQNADYYIDIFLGILVDIYFCVFTSQVDTHIHASSSMNQKHLLRFIKKKVKKHGDDVVSQKDGKPVTLAQVGYR